MPSGQQFLHISYTHQIFNYLIKHLNASGAFKLLKAVDSPQKIFLFFMHLFGGTEIKDICPTKTIGNKHHEKNNHQIIQTSTEHPHRTSCLVGLRAAASREVPDRVPVALAVEQKLVCESAGRSLREFVGTSLPRQWPGPTPQAPQGRSPETPIKEDLEIIP